MIAVGAMEPFRSVSCHVTNMWRNTCGSSNSLFLFGYRSTTSLFLRFGLWQKTKACLAPRKINTYIEQGIGTTTWTGKFHDTENAVGLSGY